MLVWLLRFFHRLTILPSGEYTKQNPLGIKKEGGRRPPSKMTRVLHASDCSFNVVSYPNHSGRLPSTTFLFHNKRGYVVCTRRTHPLAVSLIGYSIIGRVHKAEPPCSILVLFILVISYGSCCCCYHCCCYHETSREWARRVHTT